MKERDNTTIVAFLMAIFLLSIGHAGDGITVKSAKGYLSESLEFSRGGYIERVSLGSKYVYLVTTIDYRVTIAESKEVYWGSYDTRIRVSGEKTLTRNVGRINLDGQGGSLGKGTICHTDPADNGKGFKAILVYPVPKGRTQFTFEFKANEKISVDLTPALKNNPSQKQVIRKLFQTCSIKSATTLDSFINTSVSRDHDVDPIEVARTSLDCIVEVVLLIKPSDSVKYLYFDHELLTLRSKENMVCHRYLYDRYRRDLLCIERAKDEEWPEEGARLLFYAKMPRSCKEFEVLYMGYAIAGGRVQTHKKRND